MSCAGDNGDCPEPVEAANLCRGHRERQKRGRPIDTPLRDYGDKWGTVFNAWERLLQVNGFNRAEFEAAKDNAQKAMKRWLAERYHLVPKRKPSADNVPKPTDS